VNRPPAIRLVPDLGIPRDSAGLLRAFGYECTDVGEVGMENAADEAILDFSLVESAVIVTLDADFHTILAVTGAAGPSAIRLRMQGLGAAEVVEAAQRVLAGFESDLRLGALVTMKVHKITCHRLPIGSYE
jgi:predicted nuclease of predicted toxin-antitoxin system